MWGRGEEPVPCPTECRDAEEVALGWGRGEEPVPRPSECREAEEVALRCVPQASLA